jgi:hypothetical protein
MICACILLGCSPIDTDAGPLRDCYTAQSRRNLVVHPTPSPIKHISLHRRYPLAFRRHKWYILIVVKDAHPRNTQVYFLQLLALLARVLLWLPFFIPIFDVDGLSRHGMNTRLGGYGLGCWSGR